MPVGAERGRTGLVAQQGARDRKVGGGAQV